MNAPTSLQGQDPSLGLSAKLPQELRDRIYTLALPEGFQQEFEVQKPRDPSERLLQRNRTAYRHKMFAATYVQPDSTPNSTYKYRTSKPLSIFYVSTKLREEAAQSMLLGYVCEVEVAACSYKTNFPIFDPILSTRHRKHVVNLGIAKELKISVGKPKSDATSDRCVVEECAKQVVSMMNNIGCQLPRVQASLVNWHQIDPPYFNPLYLLIHHKSLHEMSCNENDYAMLLGPLMRLEHAERGFAISCTSPPFSDRAFTSVLAQIDSMETAMKGLENNARYLFGRQIKFDIKHILAIHVRHNNHGPHLNRHATPIRIDEKTARKLLAAIKEMIVSRYMLIRFGKRVGALPGWTRKLEEILRRPGKKVIMPKLQTAVFGGKSADEILIWGAKGKGPNPIY